MRAHFGISNYQPTILESLKERNSSFTPKNVDPTIQTFEIAIKQDIINHETRHLPHDNLTNKQRKALRELMDREDLVITRADKGGAIVIWGIEEYLQ